MPGLTPAQVQKIHEYIHARQKIHAIRLYREATGVGLAEAKDAIEEMARNELMKPPSDVQRMDNPILDTKIRSLLARRKKIEAVKIYREEYGVSLKDAKDAVDQIEVSMKRESASTSMPYESAISGDPFAEDGAGGRRMLVLAAGLAIALCGLGAFFLLVNP